MTKEGFISRLALEEETLLRLPTLTYDDAVEIGVIATNLRKQKMLSIEIQIRVGNRIVFQASFEGSTLENDLSEGTQAIHGGAIPLATNKRLKGLLIISSLTQVENYLFAFQVLTDFFSEKVKEF